MDEAAAAYDMVAGMVGNSTLLVSEGDCAAVSVLNAYGSMYAPPTMRAWTTLEPATVLAASTNICGAEHVIRHDARSRVAHIHRRELDGHNLLLWLHVLVLAIRTCEG